MLSTDNEVDDGVRMLGWILLYNFKLKARFLVFWRQNDENRIKFHDCQWIFVQKSGKAFTEFDASPVSPANARIRKVEAKQSGGLEAAPHIDPETAQPSLHAFENLNQP